MGDQAEYMEQLTVGTIVEGKVKSLTKFGAFIMLPDGSTGMVHISEVANRRLRHPSEAVKVGDVVKVVVLSVDEKRHRISLSMKQAGKTEAV